MNALTRRLSDTFNHELLPLAFIEEVLVGIAATVVGGGALALLGLGARATVRRWRAGPRQLAPAEELLELPSVTRSDSSAIHEWIHDYATGAQQALMASRELVSYVERSGVLIDLPEGGYAEPLAERFEEAWRTLDEVEARLPRVQLLLGADSTASRAAEDTVRQLREAVEAVSRYAAQPEPAEGAAWSEVNLRRARDAYQAASEQQTTFVSAVSSR